MNTRLDTINILFFGLILTVPFPSFSIPASGEVVIQQGEVNDDYYAAGGTVNVDANIAGDAVIAGGDIFIGDNIKGDAMAAGGSISIRGEVLDDVRIAGGQLNIDANIADDLIAAGGEIRVSSGSNVGGEAWLAGGDVFIAGTINKGLMAGAGVIRIAGTIRGDVVLESGQIEILEGAVIEGSLHYKSPDEATIHPNAKIAGDVSFEQVGWDRPHRGYGIIFALTLVIAAIVLFLLFPKFTVSAAARVPADPWRSLGIGFGLFLVTPIAALILMGIVLGVWVGLSIMAIYFVVLLTGLLVSCFFVGDWGARLLRNDVSTTKRRLISVTLAIFLLSFIQKIPVVGGLLLFALLLFGLGASILQLHYVYNSSGRAK